MSVTRPVAQTSRGWDLGRRKATEDRRGGAVLVLDEIQEIPAWSDLVKRRWDEDTRAGTRLKVVLLGSAPLLIEHGSTESLAGRFAIVRVPHWSFSEMREAFGWNLDRYLYFGGYPGAATLVEDPARWAAYVLDSLIETTISRDILSLTRVDKPALLRQLFRLSCDTPDRSCPIRRWSASCRMRGIPRRLPTICDFCRRPGSSQVWRNSPARVCVSAGRVPSCSS